MFISVCQVSTKSFSVITAQKYPIVFYYVLLPKLFCE